MRKTTAVLTTKLITKSTNDIQQIQMVSMMLLRIVAYAETDQDESVYQPGDDFYDAGYDDDYECTDCGYCLVWST